MLILSSETDGSRRRGDQLRKTLYDYCVDAGREELLRQWDTERNGEATPSTVSYGSRRKSWWKCDKGHRWQTAVYTRTGGNAGCPYCAGKRVLSGDNSLAVNYPELARQWHPTRNGDLRPESIAPGTHRKVWWRCEKGHEWQAVVKSRVSGCGCPICTNRKLVPGENDLAATHPELARQWHPTKNGSLTPDQVGAGSRKRVWWVCDGGHEWQAGISARSSNGSGCPVCSGKTVIPGENDLASHFPAVAAQWHPDKNAPVTPKQVSAFSNQRVWWRCELGHEWQAVVAARTTQNADCPYCTGRKVLAGFNDLATLEPMIAAQWHPTLNGALTPELVTVGSHKKVWWQCREGHVWKAVVYSRTGPKKCGCPVCAGRVKEDRQRRYTTAMAAER